MAISDDNIFIGESGVNYVRILSYTLIEVFFFFLEFAVDLTQLYATGAWFILCIPEITACGFRSQPKKKKRTEKNGNGTNLSFWCRN